MTGAEPFDAVIIGAGPGGLTGAIYLGRFRRRALVIDGGDSRAGWIPVSHNHPGFPGGIPGRALLARMREQARLYGATFRPGEVSGLRRERDGFIVEMAEGTVRAANVLLATGVKDVELPLAGLFGAVQKGLVRVCPICDAYEVIDQKVGVIGAGDHGAREALFLRDYSDQVTLLLVGEPADLGAPMRRALDAAGVAVNEAEVSEVVVQGDRIVALEHGDGHRHPYDVIYSALGSTPRSDLATEAGAKVNQAGCLIVSLHQMTSVEGLYAAGDVVRGLNQISVAQAEAAIAATDIHNRLRS